MEKEAEPTTPVDIGDSLDEAAIPTVDESEDDDTTEQMTEEEGDEEEEEEVERETRKYEILVVKTPLKERISSDILNIFEITELVNSRIVQINEGGEVFTDVRDLTDATTMAQRELASRKCPLMVQRVMREKIDKPAAKIYRYVEDWDPNEMIHAVTYDV